MVSCWNFAGVQKYRQLHLGLIEQVGDAENLFIKSQQLIRFQQSKVLVCIVELLPTFKLRNQTLAKIGIR